LLFASKPDAIRPVLGIVQRVIAGWLADEAAGHDVADADARHRQAVHHPQLQETGSERLFVQCIRQQGTVPPFSDPVLATHASAMMPLSLFTPGYDMAAK
jgi:hypothetical protein